MSPSRGWVLAPVAGDRQMLCDWSASDIWRSGGHQLNLLHLAAQISSKACSAQRCE